MISTKLKQTLANTIIYKFARRLRYGSLYTYLAQSGHLNPPPYIVKRLTILIYAQLYSLSTFIETGTYLGDTVDAVKDDFNTIYSIELQEEFFQQVRKRFSDSKHIHILHGDSSEVLPHILQKIQTPCLFWLDGHYSGDSTAKGKKETPVLEEMTHILADKRRHVMLIDDARLFNGYNDYPTLNQLKTKIRRERSDYQLEVHNDMIRITPTAS